MAESECRRRELVADARIHVGVVLNEETVRMSLIMKVKQNAERILQTLPWLGLLPDMARRLHNEGLHAVG